MSGGIQGRDTPPFAIRHVDKATEPFAVRVRSGVLLVALVVALAVLAALAAITVIVVALALATTATS